MNSLSSTKAFIAVYTINVSPFRPVRSAFKYKKLTTMDGVGIQFQNVPDECFCEEFDHDNVILSVETIRIQIVHTLAAPDSPIDYISLSIDLRQKFNSIATRLTNNYIRFLKYKLQVEGLSLINEWHRDIWNVEWVDESGVVVINNDRGIHPDEHMFFLGKPGATQQDADTAIMSGLPEVLIDEILVDGKTELLANSYRKAVLDFAIACESKVRSVISATQFEKACNAVRKLNPGTIPAANHYFKSKHSLDFRALHPSGFSDICRLFKTRNKIMHEGSMYYMDGSSKIQVTKPMINGWCGSVYKFISWIDENIPPR